MINNIRRQITFIYPELIALLTNNIPEFILNKSDALQNQIIVFSFHTPDPVLLDNQLTYLKTNGYSTITTEELHDYLYNKKKIPPNTIMLTFDDARASLWTTVFPLLKKYNFKCVTYLSPYPITNGETLRRQMPLPTDHASRVFTAVDSSPNPFVTWEECSVMHNSGLVDFQGHTYYHEQIYVSSKIVDFINPQYPKLFYNYDEPVISATGRNNYSRELSLGCPVYEMRPRMNGLLRYFDDEDLRHHCTAYVKNNGGHQFFKKFLWRRRLRREIKNYLQSNNDNGRYETRSEMEQYIEEDLGNTKNTIEAKLPGKKVTSMCFPWETGSDIAIEMARKTGYRSCIWGIVPARKSNFPGDSPYHVCRLSSDFIFLLPGKGRISFTEFIAGKISKRLSLLQARKK